MVATTAFFHRYRYGTGTHISDLSYRHALASTVVSSRISIVYRVLPRARISISPRYTVILTELEAADSIGDTKSRSGTPAT